MDSDQQDAAGGEDTSGLIRRVRRLAKLSQRELAHELGVSQSAVAKWETARTSPSALMLTRLLDVAQLKMVAVTTNGDQVQAMKAVAARDAAGRRYPAHTYVWAEGWWVPDGAETTAWFNQIRWRSEVLELPRVRHSRRWQCGRSPTIADINDHPTRDELLAEAREGGAPPRRNILPIPESACQDSRKSRNRRIDDFRALAGAVSLARDRLEECGEAGGWWVQHHRTSARHGPLGPELAPPTSHPDDRREHVHE